MSNEPPAAALYHQARAALDRGDSQHALGLLREAIKLAPHVPQCFLMLGLVHERLNRVEDAMKAYGEAICLDPDSVEALDHYKRCIEQIPGRAEAYNHLGIALADANRPHPAETCFHRAIELAPDYAVAFNNRGLLYKSMGRYAEAIASYSRAIELNPTYANAHWNLALTLLLTGRFLEGWEGFKWRRRANLQAILASQRQAPPTWDGAPFRHRRLLIRYEQGLGDNVQFVRYLPMVKRLGGSVIVETLGPLMELLRQIREIDELVEASADGRPSVEFDLFAFAMDLPGIFKTTLSTIPADIPYLYADIPATLRWQTRLTQAGLKVGIVWAGSAQHSNDRERSCPLAHFSALARVPGVTLFSLQKGGAAALREASLPIQDLSANFHDFAETAAAMACLDLVISVDTACLHLAGALGRPVWALLPAVPDWRWLTDRTDTPWYPTMRLFRQPKPGDWDAVFTRIVLEMGDLVQKKPSSQPLKDDH